MNNQILCFYKNTSNQIQVAYIHNQANQGLEKVVFPGQQLLFEATPETELEIYASNKTGHKIADKIICSQLQVAE